MADLKLVPSERKDKVTRERIEMIGQLEDEAEQLVNSPILNIPAIKSLAERMREIGLIKASRALLERIGES